MSPFIEVRVAAAAALNPLIRHLVLQTPTGEPLPTYTAGAHVKVQVQLPDGTRDWRHYSLINPQPHVGATAAPDHYDIAVRREDEGRGGSRFMHSLQVGDRLLIEAPKNDFPLGLGNTPVLLVAGGIGVTPLLSMAAELRATGRPVRMMYAGRSRTLLAFVPELQTLLGDALQLHTDDEAGAPLDTSTLLDGCAPTEEIYMCGPKPMLDALLTAAQVRGWPAGRVHFELFSTPAPEAGDQAFDVVLKQTGTTHRVSAKQSILDCLIENGCDPLFDCKRGECGVCAVPVLEGEVDHRDYVLSASEKAAHNVIQICVSRARSARLVLDL